ncbi:unnamed protein product [Adineta steineri]|uniref:Microbial-type PARG catalytic domain-containing protein n=1 Tax=Adineta steineri TaxID=433720 RepID=A0A813S0T9_9BILA|nr:unnamed protein product [Adineta steineri]CAF0793104.1 unnamed protein product [Adineta steineri]
MTDILVYVPDLPVDVSEDELEAAIETRLKIGQRIEVDSVKCYSKLGIAVIKMTKEDDKHHLVSDVESIVLNKDLGINISFIDKLELGSYIVIDQKLKNIPSADELAQHYSHAYKTSKVRTCETVSVQFPNVFRISFKRLDELIQAANAPNFKIDTVFATVYPRAELNFLEDLPPHTDEKQITAAIAAQIAESQLSTTSFYVQHNRQTGNAIIIASKSMKKWAMEGFLTIDGRNISKKHKLPYRVLVSPVPHGFDLDKILRNKLFGNRVASHKLIDDKLIIELNDLNHYNDCVEIGGLGIDGKALIIKPHTVVSDPDSCELDALNWYETAMLDIKPDITTIITDHQHPIFRFKWNAANFVEQMKKAETSAIFVKGYDLTRHLLRVTVMLNTIGALRKMKYIVDDKEIKLKFERTKTIGYNHQSKLFMGKKVSESDLKTPYLSTTVKVINQDCLVLCEQLVAEGRRPLVLNMANAASPGGGYRKGDGAQEENIFRRSDYYHSLDGDLADKNRSERLYCTPKGEQKPLVGFANYYPMDEFGAIYTSGITVFRGTEQDGYPYKKEPLYNMCAIAMAAYRDPPLTSNNTLQNRTAMNTHRKIENIFAIGYHQKHDCLVLSAIGCGAFKNPPEHVALLFKSVILQYAGYFDTIYFAIIDDHNAGHRVNPNGNYRPFKDILHDLVVRSPQTLRVDGITGPYRILDKTSDGQLTLGNAYISQSPPCQHGNNCRDIKNMDHSQNFSHPPRCSLQSTSSECDQINDEVHMATFMHTRKCDKGGVCDNEDAAHWNDCYHPDFCKNKSHCIDYTSEHLFSYRHLPACPDGMDCSKYLNHDDDHKKAFRHFKSICPDDNCCSKFYDETHTKKTIHSFREPCPFTPYICAMYVEYFQAGKSKKVQPDIEQHCLQYSHVCPYGRLCRTTEDKHYVTTIHIARHICPDGDKCTKMNKEIHLESYTHPGIRDIRLVCKHPGYKCHQRFDHKHLTTYRHGQNFDHLTVAPSSNFNSHIDFVQNQRHLIKSVNSYISAANWKNTKVSHQLQDWIQALQPVHRCRKEIFESILVHGHVMSRKYMKKLEIPTCVANAVLQHNRVRSIILKHNSDAVKKNAFELIKSLVIAEFAKTGADGIVTLDPDHEDKVKIAKTKLKISLNDHDLKVICDWTLKIARVSIALHGAPMGIGFDVDERMETDKHVFSILGPHLGYYYGDIVITFKQDIMFHPDANFSVQAATSFNTGRTYLKRPWVTNPSTLEGCVKDFHHSKLHCSVPRYEYATAMELAAITGRDIQSMDVDINDVLHRWNTVDSHETFEGHLPQLIPLDYVDCVYMPINVFESLIPEAQRSAKELFKDSLIIYDQPVDIGLLKPGGTVPLDVTRKPYLNYIADQLNQKIQERMNTPRISRGIVITVPSSNFDEHIVLPMTISQSYDLYRLDKNTAPDRCEYTYIYWQAMRGDMMLTIANEKIQPSKDQPNLRCLICYVAEKPSTNTEQYYEQYSYLNNGHPLHHSTNVYASKFKVKSNVFYRGCNTDDFFTFCLQLNHKTNEVILSHAGPNGIYNHEKISHQFNKSDLDISRIDYVHVSGGNQDVPIRNLTIHHEPILELHPTFDKDFKLDTSRLLGNRYTSMEHNVYESHYRNASKDNHNVAYKPHKPRVASTQPLHSRPPLSAPPEKMNIFRRLKRKLFGTSTNDKSPALHRAVSNQDFTNIADVETPAYDRSRNKSSKATAPSANYNPSRTRTPSPNSKPLRARTPPLISSKLSPCRDSIYCLNQDVKDHIDEFSHPCRFNELCRRQRDEPHLIHQRHNISKCTQDRDCNEKTNPIHRAQYRHQGLSDFLIPCRYQDDCYIKSEEHRLKYFHGEEIPLIKKNKSLAPCLGRTAPKSLIPCNFRNDCRNKNVPQHTARYSHLT